MGIDYSKAAASRLNRVRPNRYKKTRSLSEESTETTSDNESNETTTLGRVPNSTSFGSGDPNPKNYGDTPVNGDTPVKGKEMTKRDARIPYVRDPRSNVDSMARAARRRLEMRT